MKTVPKAAQATTPEVIPFTFTGQSSPKSNQGTVPTPKPKNKMYKIISIKGKTGKIIKMIPKEMKAIVSEINKVKKNQKPDNNNPGGIIDKEMPLHISNLAFYDPQLKKGIKIGYKISKDKKTRINKSTGKEI